MNDEGEPEYLEPELVIIVGEAYRVYKAGYDNMKVKAAGHKMNEVGCFKIKFISRLRFDSNIFVHFL